MRSCSSPLPRPSTLSSSRQHRSGLQCKVGTQPAAGQHLPALLLVMFVLSQEAVLHSAYACMCGPLCCPGTGEMSATVVGEPQAWTKAVARVKADMVAGREDAGLLMPNLKAGISTNFNKLCACVLMDLVDPNLYLTLLPEAMKKVEAEFNKSAIVALYDAVDFIGISSYAGACFDAASGNCRQ